MSTNDPHTQVWAWQTGAPNRKAIEIRRESLSSKLPSEGDGSAFNQASDSSDATASRRAFVRGSVPLASSKEENLFETVGESHAFWLTRCCGGGISGDDAISHLLVASRVVISGSKERISETRWHKE